MKISILSGLIAILSACITVGPVDDVKAFKNGYKPKFQAGDCIRMSESSRDYHLSDGTPAELIYIDYFDYVDGFGAYVLRMVHPQIGVPTYHLLDPVKVDDNFDKIECR